MFEMVEISEDNNMFIEALGWVTSTPTRQVVGSSPTSAERRNSSDGRAAMCLSDFFLNELYKCNMSEAQERATSSKSIRGGLVVTACRMPSLSTSSLYIK